MVVVYGLVLINMVIMSWQWGGAWGWKEEEKCAGMVSRVKWQCMVYVAGAALPAPTPNNPCCQALQRASLQNQLSCLCSHLNFATLNQRALFSVDLLCRRVPPLIGPHCPNFRL